MKVFSSLCVAALLGLPLATMAASFGGSGQTARISLVRLDSLGRVFVGVNQTPTAATNDCPPVPPGGFSSQSGLYWFDSTSLQGRILYNQVLSAYTSQSKVSGSATGSCLVFGIPIFPSGQIDTARYQPLTSLTVFTP
jgi:hypothetical protein